MGKEPGTQQSLRLLHLEDNPRDAKLCRIQLEQAGFVLQADVVTSSEEFKASLHSIPYDIVLADYNLPGWTGLDALETLQCENKDIPLILVTGTLKEET